MGGPVGAAGGSFLANQLRRVGTDVIQRQLSPREEERVGAVALAAIESRLKGNESPRNDGFFVPSETGRPPAHEILESVMMKAQREPEEQKIEYMGYLLAKIAFDATTSKEKAHVIIKIYLDS